MATFNGRNLKVYKKPSGYVVKTPVGHWLAGPFADKEEAYRARDEIADK